MCMTRPVSVSREEQRCGNERLLNLELEFLLGVKLCGSPVITTTPGVCSVLHVVTSLHPHNGQMSR